MGSFPRPWTGALAAALVITALAVPAAPAGAATADGCRGRAVSTTGDGKQLDTASAPGAGATEADPLRVDMDGSLSWRGTTEKVVRNGSYAVKVESLTVASGDVANDRGKAGSRGVEDVSDRLDEVPVLGPVVRALDPTLVMKVTWDVSSADASCTGTAFVKVGDDPLFSPLWMIGAVLLLVALALLFWPGVFVGEMRTGKARGTKQEEGS